MGEIRLSAVSRARLCVILGRIVGLGTLETWERVAYSCQFALRVLVAWERRGLAVLRTQ